MKNKTEQLLAYLLTKHPDLSITSLMKLAYLVDLVNIKKNNNQISNFGYVRYKHGPFDSNIYDSLDDLLKNHIISEKPQCTSFGEFITYHVDNKDELCFNQLTDSEKATIDEVVDSVQGFGAKALVELAYRTKPMKKVGATIGGEEGLNTSLDMWAV
jgi:uncharacterized phage-associated protein